MSLRPGDREELQRAAAAHVTARRGEDQQARRLAQLARAAAEGGASLREIAEIVNAGSREALVDDRLVA
jgi:hypothetical protein